LDDSEALGAMMPFETYAQRRRREQRNGQTDVYVYDEAPAYLRHQISEAFLEGIGTYELVDSTGFGECQPTDVYSYNCWKEIDRTCRKEIFPYLSFVDKTERFEERVTGALNSIADMDEWLSVVEICCLMLCAIRDNRNLKVNEDGAAQEALTEVNRRFEQHQVGYQFENGRIIRKDSELVHAEMIKPALALLTAPKFSKANEDFMTAHEHYRTGAYGDAVTAANRAFESMLKVICDLEKWTYGSSDTAPRLVTVVTNNGLFTHDFDAGLMSYAAMLRTGLPVVRNNAGGHGQGVAANKVTAAIARYAISLTASNLIFISKSYEAMKAE
jgi:AbiJ N-terminal domain 4